jgi:hypothetical protein
MLSIRDDQFEALSRDLRERFLARFVEHVQAVWPDRVTVITDEAIRAQGEQGIRLAERYDIRREVDVLQLLDLFFAFGWDFERGPPDDGWAQPILSDPQLVGREKVERLCQAARQQLSSGDD